MLTLHLLHGFAFIALPWGGATAMLRSDFHDYGVAGVLRTKVLDDFPLGQRLLRFGIRAQPVATAILDTHLAGQTLDDWNTWLTRQLLYLKYCLPSVWLPSALVVWVLGGPILLAVAAGLGGLAGLVSPNLALVSLGFLLAVTAIGAWCRTLVPRAAPLGALAPGLLCQHFHGLPVLPQDLVHRHHRLARHLLPGSLGRQSPQNYPSTGTRILVRGFHESRPSPTSPKRGKGGVESAGFLMMAEPQTGPIFSPSPNGERVRVRRK